MAESDPLDRLTDFLELLRDGEATFAGLGEALETASQRLADADQALDDLRASLSSQADDGSAVGEGLEATRATLRGPASTISEQTRERLEAFSERFLALRDEVEAQSDAELERLRGQAAELERTLETVATAAQELPRALADGADTTALLDNLVVQAEGVEESLSAIGESVEAAARTLGETLESGLPSVVDAALGGLTQALTAALPGDESDPLLRVEAEASALVTDAEAAMVTSAEHLIDAATERLASGPERWQPALETAKDAAEQAIVDHGKELRVELEDLLGSWEEAGVLAASWASLMPQLRQALDALERIQDAIDAMTPI